MPGWAIMPSANITRFYEGIREMASAGSVQKGTESCESQTTAKSS